MLCIQRGLILKKILTANQKVKRKEAGIIASSATLLLSRSHVPAPKATAPVMRLSSTSPSPTTVRPCLGAIIASGYH